ncbi:MAG: hypothetical protein JO273_23985 [Methylobacteriaceae bacterium]|nr:hypothetical protein [Methylobacteriaceae bacterium]
MPASGLRRRDAICYSFNREERGPGKLISASGTLERGMPTNSDTDAAMLLADKLWTLSQASPSLDNRRRAALLGFVQLIAAQMEKIAGLLGASGPVKITKEASELSAYAKMTGSLLGPGFPAAEVSDLSNAITTLADNLLALARVRGAPAGAEDKEDLLHDLEKAVGRLAGLSKYLGRAPSTLSLGNDELLADTWILAKRYGRWVGAAAFAVGGTILASMASEAAMLIVASFFGLSVASGSGVLGRIVNAVLKGKSKADVAGADTTDHNA